MAIALGVYVDGGGHVSGHMQDVALLPEIEHVLMTGSEQAREIAAAMEKAEYVDDVAAVVGNSSLPAVMVLANTRDAAEVTLAAVEAGQWVYAEKPGARDAAGMEAIAAACARTGAHFTPCYARRTFPETREVKRLLGAGAIGEVWSFQANWIASQAASRGVDSWFFSREMAGGGILHWLGCHWIDLLSFVTGRRVEAVGAMLATAEERIDVEDVACVTLRLEGGAIGTIRCGYLLDPFEGYDEYQLMTAWEGSRGSLALFPGKPTKLRLRTRAEGFCAAGETQEIALSHQRAGGYALGLLRGFIEAVETGGSPPVTEDDALYVLRVIKAAHEAARTGQEQRL
ncbi:MAG: Gfo/Idh/MocA family oxidoreductase [candidate division WS1 bacterium]|nr:Gfo/Idh/MocA family oxidoreductase [candidate division WS1 bacterium]